MPKPPAAKIGFIEPMYALGVPSLPEGPDWLYEIKSSTATGVLRARTSPELVCGHAAEIL
jgi:hypothetical protein